MYILVPPRVYLIIPYVSTAVKRIIERGRLEHPLQPCEIKDEAIRGNAEM